MKSIRYLILVVTTRCNLRCRYCYNGDSHDHADITEEIINKALETAGKGKGPLHIQITGGEPMLVPRLVEVILEKSHEKIRRPFSIGIQTNGTNPNIDLIKKLHRFNVQMGISIDGPPSVNELLRGKTDLVLKTMKLLDHFGIPFRVTTVVSSKNVGFLDKLLYMLSTFREFRGIGLDLLVLKGRALVDNEITPPSPDELGRAVKSILAVCREINKLRRIPVVIREQEKLLNTLNKADPVFFCHAFRGESLAVMPDGSLFPCGQTAGDERFRAGTVWEFDMERLGLLRNFILSGKRCNGCLLEGFCPGDCPSRVFYNERDSELTCVMYRTIWEDTVTFGKRAWNGGR